MATEKRNVLIGLQVEGEQQLARLMGTLSEFEGKLGELGRAGQAAGGTAIDPRESAARFQALFSSNKEALNSFNSAMQQTRNNTRQSTADMVGDFQRLETAIKEYETLAQRAFKAADFPGQKGPMFLSPGLPGGVERQGGPGGGFYPFDITGARIGDELYRTKPQAAAVAQQKELIRLEDVIRQLTATISGRQAGNTSIAERPVTAAADTTATSVKESAGVLDRSNKDLAAAVNALRREGLRVVQSPQEQQFQQTLASLRREGLTPGTPPPAEPPPPLRPPPVIPPTEPPPPPTPPPGGESFARGIGASLQTIKIAEQGLSDVFRDIKAQAHLDTRLEGEAPGPAAQRAVGVAELDAVNKDIANQAKLRAAALNAELEANVRRATPTPTPVDFAREARIIAEREASGPGAQLDPAATARTLTAFEKLAQGAQRAALSTDRFAQAEEHASLRFRATDPNSSYLSRAGAQFQQGFYGRRDIPFAEQIGQVAKFSLLYGAAYRAIFALSQGLDAAIQNSLAFNSAVIELGISMNRSSDEVQGTANALGQIASQYGIAPSEGVLAGARGVGIFGASGSPGADAVATQFARSSAEISFTTGRTLEQAGQDLGAIAQSFHLGTGGLGYAQDLDAYFSRRFGSTLGGTLETTAQIGSLGQEAGFSLEQVQAISSVLQSRTGQTPAAAAGFLSQIFGRAGDPSLRAKFAELGIDISQPFSDQIAQLSALLHSGALGESLRLQIINAFGRGRSGQAAAILTQEFPEIQKAAAEAKTQAPGTSDKQIEERFKSVAGALADFRGDLLILGKSIGESGLLAGLGVLVLALDQLVTGANSILEVFNLIPSPLKEFIVTIGLATLALRTQAAQSFLTGAGRGAVLAGEAGLAGSLGGGTGLRGLYAGAGGGLAGARAAAGGVPALLTGAGPWLAAAGGLIALGQLKSDADNLRVAMSEATEQLGSVVATDPDSLRTAASGLDAKAKELAGSVGITQTLFSFGAANRETNDEADLLRARAELLQKQADAEERLQQLSELNQGTSADLIINNGPSSRYGPQSRAPGTEVFGLRTVDDFATGIATLAAAGSTATQQFNTLQRALRETGDSAAVANAQLAVLPGRIFDAVALSIGDVSKQELGLPATSGLDNVTNFLGNANLAFTGSYRDRGRVGNAYSDQELQDTLQTQLQESDLQKSIRESLKKHGTIAPDEVSALVQEAVQNFDVSTIGHDDQSEGEQQALKDAYSAWVIDRLQVQLAALNGGLLTGGQFTALLNTQLKPGLDAKLGDLQTLGYAPGDAQYTQSLHRYYNTIKQTEFQPGTDVPASFWAELRRAKDAFISSRITHLDDERKAAQEGVTNPGVFRAIGQDFLTKAIPKAIDARDIAQLKYLVGLGNESTRAFAISIVEKEKDKAKLAVQSARNDFQALSAIEKAQVYGRYALYVLEKSRLAFQKALKNFRDVRQSLNGTALTGDALNLDVPEEDTDTAAQIAAARGAAYAARTDDAVAAARAAVAVAKADLDAAKPNTVEYYNALQAYYEAQRALTDTIVQTSSAARTASVAGSGDAVAIARVNLENAAAQLATETPGTLAYYQALAAYKEAQNSLDDTIVEFENSRTLANAASRGSPVVTATAQLEAARNTLQHATAGTTEYYQALSAFYQAQSALSSAIREQKFVQDQLAGDVTDPVDQAQAELRKARRQLRYDQRNHTGPDQVQADRLELRTQEANVEQAKFQQWLSDLQTNEQLERIGHGQYIRTIERRIARLRDVRHRTRQEQDQLNQLLGILNDAQSSLSGQFNIGAIKIPTPYEARRYVEERRRQIDAELDNEENAAKTPRDPRGKRDPQITDQARNTSNANAIVKALEGLNLRNDIQIDGADIHTIRRILTDILGRGAIKTQSTATSKR